MNDDRMNDAPCLACACTNPRLLSDVLGAIHLKRGQTAVCTATPALGIQFSVELSSCMQAKVTLKSDLFASLRLLRDVKFKINLTSLLDSLNVFSHSLVRDNPVEIEYRRGDALQLCIHEADHEAKCIIQTLDGADDMEDLRFPATLTNTVIIEVRPWSDRAALLKLSKKVLLRMYLTSRGLVTRCDHGVYPNCRQSEALRDALVEIDWSHPTASVCMSPDPPHFAIGVDSSSGFAYEVKFPKDAPVFSEYRCTTTQNNCYNLSQLRTCLKALALSAGPAGSTSIRMNGSDMLSLNHIINSDGTPMAFIEFILLASVSGIDASDMD